MSIRHEYDGPKCPESACRSLSRVYRTRPWQGGARRTRECLVCGRRWVTLELALTDALMGCAEALGLRFDPQDSPDIT